MNSFWGAIAQSLPSTTFAQVGMHLGQARHLYDDSSRTANRLSMVQGLRWRCLLCVQNNGVIALTRCASRWSGIGCGVWLIIFGVLAKVGGVAPHPVFHHIMHWPFAPAL